MQYAEGQVGRVFIIRIDDGEDLIASIRRFIADKNIQLGSVIFLGALMNGRMVTGPEEPVIPPLPHFVMFEGGWEVFGIGSIYPGDGGPHIHYHASVGRAGHALTGCLREKATTYLIIEAVITEFIGLQGRREFDQRTQMYLPVLGSSQDNDSNGDSEESNPLQKGEKSTEEQAKDELPGGLAEIIRDLTQR
ncbi:MAG: PPC domain-containing DNA-binding protein [Methanoregulaceae archaeon]|jgi:predicted DNA-binding protein with PD1-like motif